MGDEDLERLTRIDLFQGLSSQALERIAAAGSTRSYAPGEPVVEDGADVAGWSSFSRDGVCFYVILDGSGEMEVRGASPMELLPDQYFGETSLVDGKPRSATVTAGREGIRVFALSAWAFAPILETTPALALTMVKVFAQRLRRAEGNRATAAGG